MKKLFILLLAISSSIIISSCSKNDDDKNTSSIQTTQLIGKWQTTTFTDLESGYVWEWGPPTVEWGAWYVSTFELGNDGLFFNSEDPTNNPAVGRWEFNTKSSILTFYDSNSTAGPMDHLVHEFDVQFDSSNNLILTDRFRKYVHSKVD